MTRMKRIAIVGVVLVAVATQVTPGRAADEAGTVAAVAGTLQVQRGGRWQGVGIGAPIFLGDHLRTGVGDQAKVVLADDSVLQLAPDTEVALDKQVFDPTAQRFESLLKLARGKVRSWVSDYYREPGARFEVETPTAIAGVRGTEFIAFYNEGAALTEIVGMVDRVEVAGKLAVIGSVVQVGPQYYTEVRRGRFPSAPQRLDDARFHRYLEGLDLIGTGGHDGLSEMHPALAGHLLSPQDVPGGAAGGAVAEGLKVTAPPEFLADRLSPDVRANTQPLLEFKSVPPGQSPKATGGIKVGF